MISRKIQTAKKTETLHLKIPERTHYLLKEFCRKQDRSLQSSVLYLIKRGLHLENYDPSHYE
jgi:hypothetical protein